MMTYQPPQNILAAILQSRKQQGAMQPTAQVGDVSMAQAQAVQLPQAKAPIDPMAIFNGYIGANPTPGQNPVQTQQPSALAQMTASQVPGAQPPTNAFAQLTGIGNPNMSNGQNLGMWLSKILGGS